MKKLNALKNNVINFLKSKLKLILLVGNHRIEEGRILPNGQKKVTPILKNCLNIYFFFVIIVDFHLYLSQFRNLK